MLRWAFGMMHLGRVILEFNRVLLFGWPGGRVLEEEEKRCYYVAHSRASKEFREVETIEGLVRCLS